MRRLKGGAGGRGGGASCKGREDTEMEILGRRRKEDSEVEMKGKREL